MKAKIIYAAVYATLFGILLFISNLLVLQEPLTGRYFIGLIIGSVIYGIVMVLLFPKRFQKNSNNNKA
ncbi:MAG: hypothetical protein WAT19_09660 [Ferruginibacter sp.]